MADLSTYISRLLGDISNLTSLSNCKIYFLKVSSLCSKGNSRKELSVRKGVCTFYSCDSKVCMIVKSKKIMSKRKRRQYRKKGIFYSSWKAQGIFHNWLRLILLKNERFKTAIFISQFYQGSFSFKTKCSSFWMFQIERTIIQRG